MSNYLDPIAKFEQADEFAKGEMADAKEWRQKTGGTFGGYKTRTKQIKAEPQYKKGSKQEWQGLAAQTVGAGTVGGAIGHELEHGATRGGRVALATGAAVTAGGAARMVQGGVNRARGLKTARNKAIGRSS